MDQSRAAGGTFVVTQALGSMVVANYTGKYRSKSENLSGYRGPRLPRINPCQHQKVQYQPFPVLLQNTLGTGTVETLAGTIPMNVGNAWGESGWDSRAGTYTSTTTVQVSDADMRALLASLQGDVEPIVNVPNMILELPQALSLWKDLRDPLLAAVGLHRKSRKRIRGRLKDGSNALLAQQFGLIPLVADIKALMGLSKKVHTEVRRLTALPSSWESAVHRCPLSMVVHSFSMTDSSFARISQVSDATTVEKTVAIHYSRKKAKTLETPQLIAQLVPKLLGFTNPAAVLWEATPFSFVADWFLPIGDYLKTLDGSTLNGLLLCKDFCTTVKVKRMMPIQALWNAPQPAVCGVITDTYFRRYAGLPPVTSLWEDIRLPGIRQFTLAGALAFQRMKV